MRGQGTGWLIALAAICGLMTPPQADADHHEKGWRKIFDGKTLEGWDGNPKFWSVRDGAITGETTPENPTKPNTFIIWRGGEVGNFELKLKYRIIGGNSGIQYRAYEVTDQKWVIAGYQADIDSKEKFSGILYSERERGILALRGQKTTIGANHKPTVTGNLGDAAELQKIIKKEDWNEYHIIGKGNVFTHKINGVTMVEVVDEDDEKFRKSGLLALQLHQGPPMTVQFKEIMVKDLDAEGPEGAAAPETSEETGATTKPKAMKNAKAEPKRVLFIAGTRSHGFGSHEHKAGSMLLAESLEQAMPNFGTIVVSQGWPKMSGALEGFDCIVMYSDGGGGHMVNRHLEELQQQIDKGVGLVCIHYAVEVPKGKSGEAFLDWIGGYFETWWSVNPHWTATFEEFPKHPITRGVNPFTVNDEWYYHMRFQADMEGVTPILSDIPPASTLKRKDGAHSNNEHVRKAAGTPQHVGWAYERPDGGRGFGFTGGHYHWNWGNDNFRRVVLNAIVWASQAEVPKGGVPLTTITVDDLLKNQDYTPPGKFDRERIEKMLSDWNE